MNISFRAMVEAMRPTWLLVALTFVFAMIHVQYLLKIHHSENGMRSAFLRWRVQLSGLDDGVNVWEKYAYPNPPIMAILLKPFMMLPPTLGASAWFLVKACLALASIVGIWSLLDGVRWPFDRSSAFPPWGKALSVVLTLRPIEGDLVHGNVNLLILFLIVAMLVAFCHRRDALAGVLLGLAIACKLTPALFLAYFLYKRAWRTLLGAGTGLLLFGLVMPGAMYGWGNNLQCLRSWHNQMIAPVAAGVVSSEHKNQSLPGVLYRLFSDEPSFSDYDGDRRVVVETHNLACWDRATVQVILAACLAAFALAAGLACRTSLTERPPWLLMAEFSVVVLGMLLFCERTWKHHCVTLLLPFSVIAFGLSTSTFSRDTRRRLGVAVGLAALLMLSTSTGITEQADRFGKLAQVYGVYAWAFLVLLGCVLLILCKTNRSDTSCDFEPIETGAAAPEILSVR